MTDADVDASRARIAPPALHAARGLHVVFIVVWSCLLLAAMIAFGGGLAAQSQTYDSGPLTHEAQAGIDFLAAAFFAATAVIIVMIQVGARLLQLTIREQHM